MKILYKCSWSLKSQIRPQRLIIMVQIQLSFPTNMDTICLNVFKSFVKLTKINTLATVFLTNFLWFWPMISKRYQDLLLCDHKYIYTYAISEDPNV